MKRYIARKVVSWINGWNQEFHDAIEEKILAEYRQTFPPGLPAAGETLERMRSFYYTRLTGTATILLAIISVLVALVALVVAGIPLIMK